MIDRRRIWRICSHMTWSQTNYTGREWNGSTVNELMTSFSDVYGPGSAVFVVNHVHHVIISGPVAHDSDQQLASDCGLVVVEPRRVHGA